jgi:hypothetical protein
MNVRSDSPSAAATSLSTIRPHVDAVLWWQKYPRTIMEYI